MPEFEGNAQQQQRIGIQFIGCAMPRFKGDSQLSTDRPMVDWGCAMLGFKEFATMERLYSTIKAGELLGWLHVNDVYRGNGGGR